jgi:hypothetical protein
MRAAVYVFPAPGGPWIGSTVRSSRSTRRTAAFHRGLARHAQLRSLRLTDARHGAQQQVGRAAVRMRSAEAVLGGGSAETQQALAQRPLVDVVVRDERGRVRHGAGPPRFRSMVH